MQQVKSVLFQQVPIIVKDTISSYNVMIVVYSTTLVSWNQMNTTIASTLPYAQEPVYKDAQFTNPDAPPSYFEATAYPSHDVPQVAEVFCTHQCMN